MGWFQTILRAAGESAIQPLTTVQQLVISNGDEPQSLDPHKTVGTPEQKIMRDLLEGLFILDRHGDVTPGMALYAYSPDKKIWTFYMRPGARWSNGDPLTALDFVYSFQRLADPKTAAIRADILQIMKVVNIDEVLAGQLPPEALGVRALGPLTLQLSLSQPLGFLKKLLVHCALLPVHHGTITQQGEQWTLPAHWVGNGAYCLKKRIINDKIVLVRNPHYWNNHQTVIDQVTYLPLDEEPEIAGYRTGAIDLTHSRIPSARLQKLQQEFPKEFRLFPKPAVQGYQFNTKIPPFDDVRVRQALNLVLDRQLILQQLLISGAQPAYNVVPQGLGGLTAYQPPWRSWRSEQRLQTAKKLLKEAGYSAKNPLRFTLLYHTSEANKQLALLVSTLWRTHLGVETTLTHQEWKVFLAERRSGNYQAAHFGAFTTYCEPYALLSEFISHSSYNTTGYCNLNFDQSLDQAAECLYETERYPLYHQAEAQLAEDVPVIPMIHLVAVRLVKPSIGGFSDRNQMNLFYTKDLYITKAPLVPKKP
ncbi:ABC transporter substrate-binding protein [unidentified bacterial endosymbiont]|uniref:ABC transporter substrate-binding protein n=1 Tax=unidentified bacterial endosymbiont TaxID=2355 RepID=UPI00209DA44F|nr:ABC transporter substrate-binding protein [unidentified bacterial endosymbiont]